MEKEAEETSKEGGRGGGREEEEIITLQVHSESRQDLHSNTHTHKIDCVKEFYF